MENPCAAPSDIEGRIPPHLKKGLAALLSQENKIVLQLNSDPKLAQTFITNPGAALTQMGVKVDPQLMAALNGATTGPNPFVPKIFKLPDGSSITPTHNVTFAKHKGAKVG